MPFRVQANTLQLLALPRVHRHTGMQRKSSNLAKLASATLILFPGWDCLHRAAQAVSTLRPACGPIAIRYVIE